MAGQQGRRDWGLVRRLPGGRWHASYIWPPCSKQRHNAPHTFVAKMDAEGWIAAKRKELHRAERDAEIERIKQATDVTLATAARPEDMFDPHGWFVYILWGDDPEAPIYIGQSGNILARLGSHMGNKDRREQTRRVQFIRCPSEVRMAEIEWRLIEHYRPPLNGSSRTARRSA